MRRAIAYGIAAWVATAATCGVLGWEWAAVPVSALIASSALLWRLRRE